MISVWGASFGCQNGVGRLPGKGCEGMKSLLLTREVQEALLKALKA